MSLHDDTLTVQSAFVIIVSLGLLIATILTTRGKPRILTSIGLGCLLIQRVLAYTAVVFNKILHRPGGEPFHPFHWLLAPTGFLVLLIGMFEATQLARRPSHPKPAGATTPPPNLAGHPPTQPPVNPPGGAIGPQHNPGPTGLQ